MFCYLASFSYVLGLLLFLLSPFFCPYREAARGPNRIQRHRCDHDDAMLITLLANTDLPRVAVPSPYANLSPNESFGTSKPAIDNTPPPLPPPRHPLHPSHPTPPLLLTNSRQQLPHNARVLPNSISLGPPQKRNKFPLPIEIRRRESRNEAREDDFAAREVACIEN